MQEQEFKNEEYYQIRKSIFWVGAVIVIAILSIWGYKACKDATILKKTEYKESYKIEYGSLKSKLENIEECYLCGNSEWSMMGYYRKFDTIGVIGLNEWYVLDLRLKEYDEQGMETEDSGSMSMVFGNTQGVSYHVDAIPSRGMSSVIVSSEDDFDPTVIKNNLCQKCLDKVTDTLVAYRYEGEMDKDAYYPFMLVDFETLEVYSLQRWHTGVSVRDYWVEVEYVEDSDEIKINAYYLPERQ